MRYEVRFTAAARNDLRDLYLYIARRSGPQIAMTYVERLRTYCLGFADQPERGIRRDDVRPGLRIVGFERRVTLAFHIDGHRVVFDRLLYAGRQMELPGADEN